MSKNCAIRSGFPECGFYSSLSAAIPAITICRIITSKTRSPTPARTTTTRPSAGLIRKPAAASTRGTDEINREHEFCLNYLKSDGHGDSLGFYSKSVGIGRRHGDGADAGFARFGQRSPHESARVEFGKLVLAMPGRRFFRRNRRETAKFNGNLRKSLVTNEHEIHEKKVMKNKARHLITLLFAAHCLLLTAAAQTPTVEKIEPPNWWANMSINPVRVMIRGTNLAGANVIAPANSGLKAYNFRASENGHYLFFDVEIAPDAKAGKYNFKIETKTGTTNAPFEISPKISRANRFQGYTPDDVIYFLMPDRFADGDRSNNDPAKSKGLYDRTKGRHYHGGDLQGVIDKLPYLKSLGVTAIWTTPVYDNNDKLDTKEVYPGMPETTGYHGYGATDMYAVDEHLGDMAKLRELVDKAHALGLKVIQDQVANHTGPYHVWANDPPTPTWWNGTVAKSSEQQLAKMDGDESARDLSNADTQHRRLVYRHSARL